MSSSGLSSSYRSISKVKINQIQIKVNCVRVLIPTVLAEDIHGLVDSIGVLFLAQGILGLQGSQEGATLGFGDRPEEEVGLELGSSLSWNIQVGLRRLGF